VLRIAALSLSLLLLPGLGEARAESAQRLVLEAQEAVLAADLAAAPAERLALLRLALERLDRIVYEHPKNPLADRIIDGGRVGGLSRGWLEGRIARIENDPPFCFHHPTSRCLIAVARGFTARFPYLRDRVAAYREIAALQLRLGQRDAVRTTIEDGLIAALRIKSPGRRAAALVQVARAQRGLGDTPGALKTLDHATAAAGETGTPGELGRILAGILPLLVALEQPEQVSVLLEAAAVDARAIARLDLRVEVLSRLAVIAFDSELAALAEQLVEAARADAEAIPDAYDYAWSLTRLAEALEVVGQRGQAVEALGFAASLAERLDDRRLGDSLLARIAKLHAAAGEERHGKAVLDGLYQRNLERTDRARRAETAWWIADAYIAAGHRPSARLALELALDDMGAVAQPRRAALLSRIAVALVALSEEAAAVPVMDWALNEALAVEAPETRAEALVAAALPMARSGRRETVAQALGAAWDGGAFEDSAFAWRLGVTPLLSIATLLAGEALTRSDPDLIRPGE